jgi:hypothetical protein
MFFQKTSTHRRKNIEGESSKIGTWVCYANKIRKQV